MIAQAVRAPEYGSMGGEYGMYQGGFPGAAMGMVSHSTIQTCTSVVSVANDTYYTIISTTCDTAVVACAVRAAAVVAAAL
jgi:hypothetical protein